MSDSSKAVFLSYASQDAEAAKRICEALRAAGVEVWFDQSELVGGDAWDSKIRKQIKECALLIPIISAATQARTEGYFRLEWRLADQRTHLMAKGRPFLLPVVIDDTRDADAHVPDSFTEVQWTRLPGGEGGAAFAARVQKLLGGSVAGVADPGLPGSPSPATSSRPLPSRHSLSKWWWALPIFGVTMALLLVLKDGGKVPVPPLAPAAAAPRSEAQQLVAKARQILADGDEMNREVYALAEDLLKRAVALDPADAEAWAVYANLSYRMGWFGFDLSAARGDALRRQAERALALAPDSVEARLVAAQAKIFLLVDLPGTLRELQALAALEPANWKIQTSLAGVYRYLHEADQQMAALRRARDLAPGNPSATANLLNGLLLQHGHAEAETLLAEGLAQKSTARLLVFDAMIRTEWRGDLPGALAAQRTWPTWLLREDRGAYFAWRTLLWSRQPEKALAVAQNVPREYLIDSYFAGPRAVLTARAHELAGHTEAALADWRTVVRQTDAMLASEPENAPALHWKAWALARLGDLPAARAIAAEIQQRKLPQSLAFDIYSIAPLWATLGLDDLALAELQERQKATARYDVLRGSLDFDPAFDALRRDPRFAAVRASAAAPAFPKSETPNPGPSDRSEIDQKSVAVLAFANLSDDKANEYFSDGISEELLNVLAKIPGLKVSARTSAFYFKGKEVPVPEIAKQLGVAYVVEGSVRKQGDKVRITAQLIKADGGFHVWSDTFTRDLKDIFAVQDEIAGLIAQNLQLKLGMKSAPRVVNPEAYALFLQGRAIINRGVPDDHAKGIQCFKDSLALDGGSALTWAWLATSYGTAAAQNTMPAAPAYALAREAVNRALALDPELVEGHYALGSLQFLADWDWARADASLQHALLLAPGDANTLGQASNLAAALGQGERAVQLGRQAVALDPLNYFPAFVLGKAYFRTGRYAEMEKLAEQMIAVNPAGRFGPLFLVFARLLQGRVATAAQTAEQMEPGAFQLMCLALVRHAQGRGAESDAALNELKARDVQSRGYLIAEVYAYRGEADQAFQWLENSYRARDTGLTWLVGDPFMQSLHGNPRWGALLKKMNLPNSPAP